MDDVAQLLLAQAAGDVDVPPLSLPDLIQQQMGDDPMAAALATMLRRQATQPDGDEPAEMEEVAEVLEQALGELDLARERLRVLADALGACARCFGDDELCPVCRGRGHAGARPPDETLFAQYVAPAWRRHAWLEEILEDDRAVEAIEEGGS